MSPIVFHGAIFFVSLLCAALFAFLETAFTSLRLFQVNQIESNYPQFSKLFAVWRSTPQRLLITILIASNFTDVLCSVLVAEVMQELLGAQWGLAVGVPLATVLILLFGNIIPKSFGKGGHTQMSTVKLTIVSFLLKIFSPIVTIFMKITDLITARFSGDGSGGDGKHVVTEKEIEFLIDYSDEKGIIASDKSEMLQNVFGLGQIRVSSIMIPKSEMVMMDVHTTLTSARELFLSCRYSRIPLYDGRDDNIVGFAYQKDLLARLGFGSGGLHASDGDQTILETCMRPIIFIPETKMINELLREFLKSRRHLAVVIDEYGVVSGMVTLEDVLEEIVGEIRDEHEEVDDQSIVTLESGEYLINGKVELRRIEELLDIRFLSSQTGASVTLGGFLSHTLGHVPRKGEQVVYAGYCFQIQQASLRKVNQVLVFNEQK